MTPSWHRHPPRTRLLHGFAWLATVALFVFCWQQMTQDTLWGFVLDAPEQGADLARRMFPPRWSYLERLWQPLWETLNIATLGTLGGTLMAIPLAFLAASNTTPGRWWARPIARAILVGSRAINSLIWALLLVAVIGPGVLAGIVAIALRSIGFVGKLLYEAIEDIDTAPVEAITATGASRWQVMDYAVVPQVMPTLAGTTLLRWDINIRESTVLGLVGAGGLGQQLQSSLNSLAWPQVTLILLVILATVVASEWLSARARHVFT